MACFFLSAVPVIRHGNPEANFPSVPHPHHNPSRQKLADLLVAPAESSVYVAATLKSQTVWFMAAGRDRDQRRCQLLSRQPIPPRLLYPLSQEPNTEPGHQDRAGECEEFSQHICSLLCTFSPLWDVKSAAGPEDATTLLHSD